MAKEATGVVAIAGRTGTYLEIETVIWCPACEVDKFRVLRKPTAHTGVYQHETEMIDSEHALMSARFKCGVCGEQLMRKNG